MATTQTSTKAAPERVTPSGIAKQTIAAAEAGNWTLAVNAESGSVSVTRIFRPSDIDAYIDADNTWGAVLSIPKQTRAGSVWGTDSGSVGGAVGLDNGYYRMNKSGISKQVIDQLVKLGVGTTKPPVRGLLDSQASSLFTQRQETATATPTKEESVTATATTKSTRSKPKGTTSKGSVSTRKATRSSSATPTAVSPVSSAADVDRLKAIYDTAGVNEMRIEACRIAALEGAAKKEALKSGVTPPPMPVNDWMASEDYQQRRNGTMATSTTTRGTGTARRTSATRSNTTAEKHANCPLCGFKFTKPQAKCMSTAACEKRQAEAKAKGKSTTPKPKTTTTAKRGASRLAPQPKKRAAAAQRSKPRSGRVTKRTAA